MAGLSMLGRDPVHLASETDRRSVATAIDERAAQPLDVGTSYDIEWQARAMIGHDVSRSFGGDLGAAAKALRTEMLVVVAARDRTVTPSPALAFAAQVGAETLVLEGPCGHQAPWCEAELLKPRVRELLARPTKEP